VDRSQKKNRKKLLVKHVVVGFNVEYHRNMHCNACFFQPSLMINAWYREVPSIWSRRKSVICCSEILACSNQP